MDNVFAKIFQKPASGVDKNNASQGAANQDVKQALTLQNTTGSSASTRAVNALTKPDQMAALSKNTLDAVGQQNEALRNHLASILEGFSSIDNVRNLCHNLVDPLAQILKDTEESKKQLSEVRAKYEFTFGAHEEVKTQLANVLVEKQALSDAHTTTLADIRRLDEAVKLSEARLEETSLHLQDRTRRVEQLERDYQTTQREGEVLAEQLKMLRIQLDEKEKAVLELEQKSGVDKDHYALLQNEVEALRANVNDLTQQIGRLTRKSNDLESALERAKERNASLETALEQEQAAHAKLKQTRDEDIERSNAEIAALTLKVEAITSRADLTERLLNDARGKLRDKVFEMRALERRLQESEQLREDWSRKEINQDKDLAEHAAKVLELSTLRNQLNERVDSAEKALRAKDAILQQNAEKIDMLETRLSESQKYFDSKKAQLETLISQLTEQFEKERMEKSLAEGALKTARLERQKMQRELTLLKTGLQLSGAKNVSEAESVLAHDGELKDGDNVSRIFPQT